MAEEFSPCCSCRAHEQRVLWEPGISLLEWRGELTFCGCVSVALSQPTAVLPYQTFIVFLSPLISAELPS